MFFLHNLYLFGRTVVTEKAGYMYDSWIGREYRTTLLAIIEVSDAVRRVLTKRQDHSGAGVGGNLDGFQTPFHATTAHTVEVIVGARKSTG